MYAIISDIHSNGEALSTVLSDIRTRGVERIVCLGDVVGYGAEPEKCIDLVEKHCDFCLSGNHDYAVLTRAVHFNPLAEEAVDFTRNLLRPGAFSFGRKRARWNWLEGLHVREEVGTSLYVHGSPRDERNEYILETDLLFGNTEKLLDIFSMFDHLLFVGHTHSPGIINEELEFLKPKDFDEVMTFEDEGKYIVNVGSVGQPRDGDNRACYVLVEGPKITYVRVPYDYQSAMAKIRKIGPISEAAAGRLEQGR